MNRKHDDDRNAPAWLVRARARSVAMAADPQTPKAPRARIARVPNGGNRRDTPVPVGQPVLELLAEIGLLTEFRRRVGVLLAERRAKAGMVGVA